MTEPTNRREFLRDATILGAGLAGLGMASGGVLLGADAKPADGVATPAPETSVKSSALSEPFVIGVIGTGARGQTVAANFAATPGVRIKYLCDVEDGMLAKGQAAVQKRLAKLRAAELAKAGEKTASAEKSGGGGGSTAAATAAQQLAAAKGDPDDVPPVPIAVKDFRKILDDKEVEAVVIVTPDHWHAPMAILACKAGKHVYVEKPCSHNAREGELLVEAARKYNRVVQHGTQRRSWSGIGKGIAAVRGGEIGNVRMARAWYAAERKPIGRGNGVPVPSTLDYALWQGPAPERPFRDNLVPYNWHWFWHWGTGEMGNNAIHFLDLARWGLNVDYPKRVTSAGGRYFFADDWETPDTQTATFEFGDRMITWDHRSCQPRGLEGDRSGVAFYGDKGTLVILDNGFKLFDLKDKLVHVANDKYDIDTDHFADFVDAARKGRRPNADIEDGHKSTLLCHLANIAVRTGKSLNVDPKTGHIEDASEAELRLWTREYRSEWEPMV